MRYDIYSNTETKAQVDSSGVEVGKPEWKHLYLKSHHDVYFHLLDAAGAADPVTIGDTFKLVLTEETDWDSATEVLTSITTGITISDAANGILRIADLFLNDSRLLAHMATAIGDDGVVILGAQLSKDETSGDTKLWQGYVYCHGDRDLTSSGSDPDSPEYPTWTEARAEFVGKVADDAEGTVADGAEQALPLGDKTTYRGFYCLLKLDSGGFPMVFPRVLVDHDGTDVRVDGVVGPTPTVPYFDGDEIADVGLYADLSGDTVNLNIDNDSGDTLNYDAQILQYIPI